MAGKPTVRLQLCHYWALWVNAPASEDLRNKLRHMALPLTFFSRRKSAIYLLYLPRSVVSSPTGLNPVEGSRYPYYIPMINQGNNWNATTHRPGIPQMYSIAVFYTFLLIHPIKDITWRTAPIVRPCPGTHHFIPVNTNLYNVSHYLLDVNGPVIFPL
jgi:hypothetical protein